MAYIIAFSHCVLVTKYLVKNSKFRYLYTVKFTFSFLIINFYEGILIFDEVKAGAKVHYHTKTQKFVGLDMSVDELDHSMTCIRHFGST